jgi:uncharacterized protein YbjT (DUF2867 family)
MQIVVVGGTGMAGSKIVAQLRDAGHDAVPAARGTGVDTVTGVGLGKALDRADVLIDASNARRSPDPERFFSESARMLLAAAAEAGVKHVVVLSIVGVDRLGDTGYFRGKQRQEELVRESGLPFSIVRSTQFVEFVGTIADAATRDGVVRLPPIFLQPIAVDEAARAVCGVALGTPLNAVVDVAGPTRFRLDQLVAQTLESANDSRRVIADTDARYFGARVSDASLIPDQQGDAAGS